MIFSKRNVVKNKMRVLAIFLMLTGFSFGAELIYLSRHLSVAQATCIFRDQLEGQLPESVEGIAQQLWVSFGSVKPLLFSLRCVYAKQDSNLINSTPFTYEREYLMDRGRFSALKAQRTRLAEYVRHKDAWWVREVDAKGSVSMHIGGRIAGSIFQQLNKSIQLAGVNVRIHDNMPGRSSIQFAYLISGAAGTRDSLLRLAGHWLEEIGDLGEFQTKLLVGTEPFGIISELPGHLPFYTTYEFPSLVKYNASPLMACFKPYLEERYSCWLKPIGSIDWDVNSSEP